MPRQIKQTLPQPPAEYDQSYFARLADIVNRYMLQREAQGEIIAARYIFTDPPDSTVGLPLGALYVKQCSGCPNVVSIVVAGDPE